MPLLTQVFKLPAPSVMPGSNPFDGKELVGIVGYS